MSQQLQGTKYPNLYIDGNSGIYYFRIKKDGRAIKKSLKTIELNGALVKLAAELKDAGSARISAEDITWHAAVEMWLTRNRMRRDLKHRALQSIEYFADKARDLAPCDRHAREITADMCESWWNRLEGAARTANGILGAVRQICALLIEQEIIETDPSRRLKKRKVWKNRLSLPSKRDFRKIVEWTRDNSPNASFFIEFLAYSGCRIGEALLIKWKDVDGDILHIPGNKHATGWRTLPINNALGDLLERIRLQEKKTAANQTILKINTPRYFLDKACIELQIPHVRVHDLRHFFATSCIESGIDIPTVSRWLGHRDGGALAMRVYGHLRDEHSLNAAKKLQF